MRRRWPAFRGTRKIVCSAAKLQTPYYIQNGDPVDYSGASYTLTASLHISSQQPNQPDGTQLDWTVPAGFASAYAVASNKLYLQRSPNKTNPWPDVGSNRTAGIAGEPYNAIVAYAALPDDDGWTTVKYWVDEAKPLSYVDLNIPNPTYSYRLIFIAVHALGIASIELDWNLVDIDARVPGSFAWQRTLALGGPCVADAVGNVFVSGTDANAVFVAKYDVNGALTWRVVFIHTTGRPYDIRLGSDGSIYLIGTYVTANFGGSQLEADLGFNNCFVLKMDTLGAHVWSVGFAAHFNATANVGFGLALDRLDNVYLTGYYVKMDFKDGNGQIQGTSYDSNVFVMSLSGVDGTTRWAKPLSTGHGYGVACDSKNNVWATGDCGGSQNFGGGSIASTAPVTAYLVKYDKDGNHLYSKGYGISGRSVGKSVAVALNDNVLLTGSFSQKVNFGGSDVTVGDLSSQQDIYFVGFTSAGVEVFEKHITSSAASSGSGLRICTNAFGFLVVGQLIGTADFGKGNISGSMFVVKYSDAAVCLWSNGYASIGCLGAALSRASFACGNWYGTTDFGEGPVTATSQQGYLLKLA